MHSVGDEFSWGEKRMSLSGITRSGIGIPIDTSDRLRFSSLLVQLLLVEVTITIDSVDSGI